MNTAKVAAGQVATWNFAKALDGWDNVFDKVLKGLEDKSARVISLWFTISPDLIPIVGPKITPANHRQVSSRGNHSSVR
jgi:hypothetical protein